MLNLNNFRTVQNSNTRVNYDLKYSQKTNKFILSQSAFALFDIENNGFNIMTDNVQVVLQVVPNDQADVHSGREGKNKGTQFTANIIAEILKLNADAEFRLEKVVQDNYVFAVLHPMNETSEPTVEAIEETNELNFEMN